MTVLVLALASSIAWFISSLIGGGSPLILIPLITVLLSPGAIAPVITTGMLFGNGQRVGLYWRHIEWRLVAWCLPSASLGAVLGAFVVSRTRIEWLSLLLAGFLLVSVVGLVWGKRSPSRNFKVRAWYFLPIGFGDAFCSGLIGSTGPVLQPLYLGYGLTKEQVLATKSFNVLGIHLVKLIAYSIFGVLTLPYLSYGIVIGLAALPGNWLGRKVLEKMSEQQFQRWVITFIGASALWMVWQQRGILLL
ncbi:MAG: sulfite exporter TauE/SafE family protein [Cyanobacteria bacterium P01_G01_bin.54]